MIPSGFLELMERHHIIVAVAVSVDTGNKRVVGDRTALESDYMLRSLFDDLSVRDIQESLDGQILPRMVQQGKVFGMICRPTEDMIVGLYCHNERDVGEQYQTSKIVDAEVRDLWT